MNLELLSKLAWCVVSDPTSLLAMIFTAKYEKGKEWWPVDKNSNSTTSYTWKSIEKALKVL